MPKPLVFISHSAKDDTARRLLDCLEQGLSDQFRVWTDHTRLVGGDDWRREIAVTMEYCHAAVLLCGDDVFTSVDFKYEVDNLLARWYRSGQEFLLLPVVLSDAVEAKLHADERLKKLGALNANYVRPPLDDAELLAQLKAHFAPLLVAQPTSPFEELERQVARLLRNVDPADLVAAAEAGGHDTSDWDAEQDYPVLLARALLSSGWTELWSVIRELWIPVESKEKIEKLFELVAPSWVSPQAAHDFRDALERKAGERAVVVDSEHPLFTPQMYLRMAQAHVAQFSGKVVPVASAHASYPERSLVWHVREVLKAEFGCSSDDALKRELENYEQITRMPVVAVIRLEQGALRLLPQLQQDDVLSRVTLCVLCDCEPPEKPDHGEEGFIVTAPRLSRRQEEDAVRCHTHICGQLYPAEQSRVS